jgi:hypothetical protein
MSPCAVRRLGLVAGIAAICLAAAGAPARAATVPIPGKLIIIKSGKLTKFISKPTAGNFPLPAVGGSGDPTLTDASFSVVDNVDNSRAFFADLPPSSWKGLGTPAGLKGFKYKGAGIPGDPCKVVLVKGTVIKAVCKDDQFLDPPLPGAPSVKIRLGSISYSSLFGGLEIKNVSGIYKAAFAPECVPSPLCCGGNGFHAFTTGEATGDCGDVTDLFGDPSGTNFPPPTPGPDLACSGLYFGGGGNAVPLPLTFPSQEQTITALTSCAGQSATLGAATSTATGSNRNCSAPGCLFGPPVPLPNAGSTPTSVCVVFSVNGAVSGALDCGTGAQTLDLPLNSEVYLTGDSSTDPGSSIPGIQSCPICSAGSCIGGPNNGMACTPASADGSTTHDCPPAPSLDIGPVPLAFGLSSGTVSWTATPATNDLATTAAAQTRDFTGFCRDVALPGGTLCFKGDPAFGCPASTPGAQKCWENGMAVGPACSGTYETCEQRNNGAFGPGGGAILTITAFGKPQDDLLCGGASTGVLASIFSIAPTFNSVVDAVADFPGPAAVTFPVAGALCSTGNSCPGS